MFVAHCTVQVKQDEGGKITVAINPIGDYRVHHNEKNFTVFVGDDENCLMLPIEQPFGVVKGPLWETLLKSAISQVKIAVEIAVEDPTPGAEKYKITSLRIPATLVSK